MSREVPDRRSPRAVVRGVVLLATLCLAACGGGGGGSDALPCTALAFDRALATPSAGDVYLDAANTTCSTIGVSVLVNNLSRIYTVGFDLNFPDSLLSYDSYTLGPLMLKGSPANAVQVFISQAPGALSVIVSRFGSDPPVDAVGSEALITFRFTRVAAGSGAMDFDVSGSTQSEIVQDEVGGSCPATFAPGHGGMAVVP